MISAVAHYLHLRHTLFQVLISPCSITNYAYMHIYMQPYMVVSKPPNIYISFDLQVCVIKVGHEAQQCITSVLCKLLTKESVMWVSENFLPHLKVLRRWKSLDSSSDVGWVCIIASQPTMEFWGDCQSGGINKILVMGLMKNTWTFVPVHNTGAHSACPNPKVHQVLWHQCIDM